MGLRHSQQRHMINCFLLLYVFASPARLQFFYFSTDQASRQCVFGRTSNLRSICLRQKKTLNVQNTREDTLTDRANVRMRRTMPSECCQLFIRKSRAGGLVHVCNLCLCVCVSVSHRACGTGPARMAPRLSVWSFGHVLLRTDVPISFQDDWTGCFFCD